MKTKELKKRVREIGYHIDELKWCIYVKAESDDKRTDALARVDKRLEASVTVNSPDDLELAHIILEYACTPIEEREEEERFYYRLPGIGEGRNYIKKLLDNGCLVVDALHFLWKYQTQFTASEIAKMTDEEQKLFEIAVKERADE